MQLLPGTAAQAQQPPMLRGHQQEPLLTQESQEPALPDITDLLPEGVQAGEAQRLFVQGHTLRR